MQYGMEQIIPVAFKAVASKLPESARRSFQLDTSNIFTAGMGNLIDKSRMTGGVTPIGIAKSTPGIIHQTDYAEQVFIPNGWDTERLTYILMLETPRGPGITLQTYIQGYTDYFDPSISGLMDPNTRFYINSVININKMVDQFGNPTFTPVSTFNLIHNGITQELQYSKQDTEMLMRPEDIVTSLAVQSYENAGLPVNNLVSQVGPNGKASEVKNNIGIDSLSKVINGYISATSIGVDDDMNTMLNVSDIVAEPIPESTPFLAQLSAMHDTVGVTSFTKGELDMLFPNINELITDIPRGNFTVNQNMSGEINFVSVPTVEARMASEFADNALSALVSAKLSKLAFTITNLMGSVEIQQLSHPGTFLQGIDPTNLVLKFMTELEHIIWPNISKGNMIPLTITADIDMFGVSTVEIMIENNPPQIFPITTATSSLQAPVVGNSQNFNNLTIGYKTILDNI